ncbi:hypothetical protein Tco_0905218 [Tanacetum coccineum]
MVCGRRVEAGCIHRRWPRGDGDGGDRWWCGRGGVDGEGDGSVERVVDEWQLVVLVLAVGGSEAGDDEGGVMMMMMEVGWRASVVVATVVSTGGAWW